MKITLKGIGISVNPPIKNWNIWGELDQSCIIYNVFDGQVYGGSEPRRKVKEVARDSDGYIKPFPGGDFALEMDLSDQSLVMEIDDERIILDANLGDFNYSPFLIVWNSSYNKSVDAIEVTIL